MPGYVAPIRDIDFVLHDVLGPLPDDPAWPDRDFTRAVLDQAARVAQEVLAPLNAVGDRQGCRLESGTVRTPDGFRAAFDSLRADGWMSLDAPSDLGGQGLPYLLHTAVNECFVSANMAFNMYQGLTHGACSTVLAHGTAAQIQTWVPRLVSCQWTATMNLTEPQCGTDLGLVRTRAEPQADGSYRITGQKIFISAGDHDLAENIVHLVLARAPGGGEGTRGLSLFIVPKLLLNPDGTLGTRNGVTVDRIERKMGIHASATCALTYDGATGWLLGDLHKGMKAMFTMMNEARLGVALQGYAVAEAAYQAARSYARDRLQGRAATGPQNPAGPADPLIVHPDIRRSLMMQKSFVEGARALTFWVASLIDRAHHGDAGAEGLASLLTPVVKGFLTDMGFQSTVEAQQVFGGHGYIEDQGLSQYVRDARIALIYEGANGVQALDLVGRKLMADGGRHVLGLFQMVQAECQMPGDDPQMLAFTQPLATALGQLRAASDFFLRHGMTSPDAALAGSHDFLHLMGHVCLGLMWTRMARAALSGLATGRGDPDFLHAKLATGRFYMARQLPACALHLARIETGAGPVMALAAEAF